MKRLTAILFCLVLFGFGIWFWILPDKVLSREENRLLQPLPKLTVSSLVAGKFSSELSTYYADQFPLRDSFVGAKALVELALGKGENNGILLGESGQLARRLFRLAPSYGSLSSATDTYDPVALSQKTSAIAALAKGMGIPTAVLLPARALDVASSAFSYPGEGSEELLAQLQRELVGVRYGDLNERLKVAYDRGEEVWYRTDHHWTTLGAYYAYCQVMRSFGKEAEILPLSSFERKTVSERFYGTLYSASGMKFVKPDRVELFLTGREDEYLVIADGRELSGFYSLDLLSWKDHYSVFLDGTHDHVEIRRKDGEARPTLLLFKDSFANSMAPFLAEHFDLVLLNLASPKLDFGDAKALVEQYGAEYLLVVWSIENLLTSDKLPRLQ